MDLLKLFWGAYAVVTLLGVIARILMIGQERKPFTPADAVAGLIFGSITFVAILATWQRL